MITVLEKEEMFRRVCFIDSIISEIETDYNIIVSDNIYDKLITLAEDLSYGKEAEKHGSNALIYLENAVYEFIENEMPDIFI